MIVKVINQVIILSLMMLIGVFAKKKNIITEEGEKSLSSFLVNITLPSLLITSFNYRYSEKMIANAESIFLYSIIIHIVIILLSKVCAYRYEDKVKKVMRFIIIFSNSGFMGYPVLEGLFGKVGIFYGAIFNIPLNIFMFSVGIAIYTGKNDIKNIKNVISNPVIISTIVGFLMFVFSIKLPYVVDTTLSSVGSMTTPLSMIIVGTMLAGVKLKDIFSGFQVYYTSFMRLILVPLVTVLLLKLMKADSFMIQICAVIEAMPSAVLASVLAQQYGADSKLAARSVFITTIISMVTIPIVVICIQFLTKV
ncbi:AEC family transporter [Clostridium ljungdahlii]|uniref:Putative transporter YfdV n=1 Tax=Clostridium ljungdahlii TaxID=1538 RepID=A0A168LL73_9CLOT|nr:AEC family transporter [Clostridium ljungdahlii]OAA83383.1 putative transporter YfdV [Clostridium ljungdahlii]